MIIKSENQTLFVLFPLPAPFPKDRRTDTQASFMRGGQFLGQG